MISMLLAAAAAIEFVNEVPPPSEGTGVICSAPDTDDYAFNIYPAQRLVHYPDVDSPQRIPLVTDDVYFLQYDDVGGPNEGIAMLDRRKLTLTTTSKAPYARFRYLQRKCRLVPTIDLNPPVRI